VFQAESTAEGFYTFPPLTYGTYTLTAAASGFASFSVKDLILVVRGGYGIYYDNNVATPALGATAPFLINEIPFQNSLAVSMTLPQVFPAAGASGPATIGLPAATRRDFRIPFTQQYALTLEHQQWGTGFRLSYTGTATRQGWWRRDANQPIADDRTYSAKPRPFPQYPAINVTENGAGHQYHGMSLEAQRRMRGGIAFQSSFSWSTDLSDLEDHEAPENAFDRLREKGWVQTIPALRFNANMVYNLPFKASNKIANGVISCGPATTRRGRAWRTPARGRW
jgi:hypothetical protein